MDTQGGCRIAVVIGIVVGSNLGNLQDFRILKVQTGRDSTFKKHEAINGRKWKFECDVGTVKFVIEG